MLNMEWMEIAENRMHMVHKQIKKDKDDTGGADEEPSYGPGLNSLT